VVGPRAALSESGGTVELTRDRPVQPTAVQYWSIVPSPRSYRVEQNRNPRRVQGHRPGTAVRSGPREGEIGARAESIGSGLRPKAFVQSQEAASLLQHAVLDAAAERVASRILSRLIPPSSDDGFSRGIEPESVRDGGNTSERRRVRTLRGVLTLYPRQANRQSPANTGQWSTRLPIVHRTTVRDCVRQTVAHPPAPEPKMPRTVVQAEPHGHTGVPLRNRTWTYI
jgi:hypothetical protein